MNDFIATEDRALLERHGLASFDALWNLKLQAVDEPNTERGGWSSVYRLDLGEAAYYLKRQSNYLTRSLARPFGEPTFAREFRNIRHYLELGIPALQAAFFAERKSAGERRAVLLTRALDGWQDLSHWLENWPSHGEATRSAVLKACGLLARRLHAAGQMHGCFYPKHIFLKVQGEGFDACLIDLEKTRPLLLGRRDRVKDLEPLLRRATAWREDDLRILLGAYLDDAADLDAWGARLLARQQRKETR
ncbi:lipopolysaccharide kinase InaA family protein [Pseudomonas sp. LRF_L74]|uniref:lipopolysaccharide kinase InaA family protein n=1 Tax=Pseudomonas sp. LRF_L74 TaxID=3369422 RepID=UPI003F635D02